MKLETPRDIRVQLQSNGRKTSAVLAVTLATGCGLLGKYDYAVDETDAGVGNGFGASGGGMGGTGVGGRGVGGVNTDGTVGSDAADAAESGEAAVSRRQELLVQSAMRGSTTAPVTPTVAAS